MTQAEMSPEQRELIEEFGLLYEEMGGTRMAGRVSAWLLLSDPPVQSLTEIADGLGVSKAAVSGAARLLLQQHIVERAGEPGHRGDFYRAVPSDPDRVVPLDHVRHLHSLLDRAIRTVATRDQEQSNYALMRDLHEFTGFMEAALPELLVRWRERHAESSPATDAVSGDPSATDPGGTH